MDGVSARRKAAYLHTGQHTHRINTHRHPCLEWDLNPNPVFEQTKTVHALERTTTVVGGREDSRSEN
jgi:hypothetical protein